ncbi:MAG: hypothetical protein HY906_04450 [Deltaproteobacteria bacterium]|nr:hypothetical protein [Deltaproteobacteria bacterium]
MSPSTPKAGTPCQVCGSADPSLTMCGGCAAAARRQLQKGPAALPPRDPRLGPCSFCSAESPDLRAMFVGPELYGDPVRLCDQCLDLCCDIVAERRLEAAAGVAATVPPAAPAPPTAAPSGAPGEAEPDPVVTLADGTPIDDAMIHQTLEMNPFGTPEKPPAAPERPGRTLLAVPAPTAAGEQWLAPKATTECPACKQPRPASSLVASCTSCFARARAPADVAQAPGPQVVPTPAPTLPLPPAGGDFACSFCHRPRALVRGLVSGPRVFVCESCITDFAVALEPHYWWAWERPGRTG